MKNIKRILYVVSTLKRCGPTNQLYELITHLDIKQYEPHVLTLSPEPKNSRYHDFHKKGISIESLQNSRLNGIFQNSAAISQVVRKFKPDLIHSCGFRADTVMASLKIRPHVATIRNIPHEDYPMTYGRFKGNILAKAHIRKMKKIDLLIGVSNTVTNCLSNKYNLRNARTIPNGVNEQYFRPASQEIMNEKRKQLGLSNKTKVFISVGHLSKLKDPLLIIEAFKRNTDPDLLLIFLGSGSLEKICRQAASNDSRIQVLGFQNNIKDYLQASDFLVSASKSEGFPNTVLEALSTGLPCILSDIPQHKEFFNYNYDVGRLFEVGNPSHLSKIFHEIVSVEKTDMSKQVRMLVEKHLSIKKMTKNYQLAYSDLVNGNLS